MKKLFFLTCIAALFSITTMAQVQDTSDVNLREEEQTDTTTTEDQPSELMQEDTTTAPIDSTGAMSSVRIEDIEVLESKEGPEHEIVYKYQGETFYIDRKEEKFVKVEESELRDSPHELIKSEDNQ
jgi:hypothetical protein